MGILADQALRRLRKRVAELEAPSAGRPPANARSSSIAHAAIILAGFVVLASTAFFVKPNIVTAVRVTDGIQQPAASTGRAAFPLGDGRCRELVFDRSKSDIVDSNTAPCDSIARRPGTEASKASASNGFVWGRK